MSELMEEEDEILDETASQVFLLSPPLLLLTSSYRNSSCRSARDFDSCQSPLRVKQAQARAEIMQRAFPAIIDLGNLWGCMCRKVATLFDTLSCCSVNACLQTCARDDVFNEVKRDFC